MNVALRPELAVLSLCAGGGGLDRAVELAVPGARTVCMVEREAFAVAALVAQMQSGALADAPVWSDARTFAGRDWRGVVDLVVAGYPCQPFSLAGQRRGASDPRHLWPIVRRIGVQTGAWAFLLENVGGHLTLGADQVRRNLARLGFQSAFGLYRASDLGLPHERTRLFILAVNDRLVDAQFAGRNARRAGLAEAAGRSVAAPDGAELADAECDRWREGPEALQPRAGQPELAGGREDLGDAECTGFSLGPFTGIRRGQTVGGSWDGPPERSGGHVAHPFGRGHGRRPEDAERGPQRRAAEQQPGPASGGPGVRPFLTPPGPGDFDAWRAIAERAPELLPALSGYDRLRLALRAQGIAPDGDPPPRPRTKAEARKARRGAGQGPARWLDARTGQPVDPARLQAAAQSALRGVADGVAPRIDQLRLLGNGVADPCGALALRDLATELSARSAGAARLVRMMEGR